MLTNPEFLFDYDIENWVADNGDKTLNKFKFNKKRTISFQFSKEGSKIIQDELERQNTNVGRSQALKRLPLQIQWRTPKAISQSM